MEFTSARGMMTIVFKLNEKILIFSKGSDLAITGKLGPDQPYLENIEYHSKKLSQFGFRVFYWAMKEITTDEWDVWNEKFNKEMNKTINEESRNKCKAKHYKKIENNLLLIGCTSVEDKLQTNVPETVKDLRAAGIKIWMLTGDNLYTAKSIGKTCHLITKNSNVIEIYNDDMEKFKKLLDPDCSKKIFDKQKVELIRKEIEDFENQQHAIHLFYKKLNSNIENKAIQYLGIKYFLEMDKQSDNNDNNDNIDKFEYSAKMDKSIILESDFISNLIFCKFILIFI